MVELFLSGKSSFRFHTKQTIPMGIFSIFSKDRKENLEKGLTRSRENLMSRLSRALVGRSSIDDAFLDELEEILVSSDVGVNTTLRIIGRIQERVARDKYLGSGELNRLLKEEIIALLSEGPGTGNADFDLPDGQEPYVIMVVGVNGVGKTTTIGKLA